MRKIIQMSWVSHNAAFSSAFADFRLQKSFCDVTICCRGNYFPAHRLILSAFSDYFKEILEQTPCKHPFILIQDAKGEDLKALLDFIYVGEVSVDSERMESFLKMVQKLEVRGFTSSVRTETQPETSSSSPPPSEFCRNMIELGKRIKKPGVEESYIEPNIPGGEPKTATARKKTGPKSKRKRGKESPSPMKIARLNLEERLEVSPPPIPPIKIKLKQEPLEESQTTAEANRTDNASNVCKEPMVIIESCAAAVELTRTPKNGKVSVMIPPSENCLTLGDSDDDFFDDDFPSDLSETHKPELDPLEIMTSDGSMKTNLTCDNDDAKGADNRKSGTSNRKRIVVKQEKEESKELSSGAAQHDQEYFRVAVKESDLQGKNVNTSATPSNNSRVEKNDTLKVSISEKKKTFDFAVSEEDSFTGEYLDPSSVVEACFEAGISKDVDEEESWKRLPLKKQKKKKKTFCCQYCSYKTQISVNLLVHLRTHTGEKPYKCSICPYRSTQKSALSTHMQRHMAKKIKCDECGFITKHGHEELVEHQKTHTDTTSYQCEYCPFVTTRYQTLERHEFKLHLKVVNEEGIDDPSQPKKIVTKKKCNPYKSRKRSIMTKKWKAYRKQKEKTLTGSCSNDENTPSTSTSFSMNENESFAKEITTKEDMKSIFDSPKVKSPAFEGFTNTATTPVDSANTNTTPVINTPQKSILNESINDLCETTSDSPTLLATSSSASVTATETPASVSTCKITNTPTTQKSTKAIPNTCTNVTTNTSTTLTTTSSKVLANTSTTLCLVNVVSEPSVIEVDPLSTAKSPFIPSPLLPVVRGIKLFNLQKNMPYAPVNSSGLPQAADDEPFLVPKVTNVCGRVPFSSATLPISSVEGRANVCSLVPYSSPTTFSISSVEGRASGCSRVPFSSPITLPISSLDSRASVCGRVSLSSSTIVPISSVVGRATSLQNPINIPSPSFALSNTSTEEEEVQFIPPSPESADVTLVENVEEESPTSLTISSVSSGVAFPEEVPFVPCVETPSMEDDFNNTQDDTEEDPLIQITSVSTCPEDATF